MPRKLKSISRVRRPRAGKKRTTRKKVSPSQRRTKKIIKRSSAITKKQMKKLIDRKIKKAKRKRRRKGKISKNIVRFLRGANKALVSIIPDEENVYGKIKKRGIIGKIKRRKKKK